MREDGPDSAVELTHTDAVVAAIPVPACIVDSQGNLTAANAYWREVFADLPSHVRGAGRSGVAADLQVTIRGPDGQLRTFAGRCGPAAIDDASGGAMLCTLVEITEMRRREEQLAFMASHDVLTGLPNRLQFEDALARALARAQRGGPGALIMLDIDNLKSYNDGLGHARGDQALVNFALLLQTHLRAGDLLARVGGDEFAVVLEDTTLEVAAEIAERMRAAAAEEAFVAEARSFDLGLSAGVVPFDGTEEPHALTDAADSALYEAKNTGRNRVVVRDTGVAAAADPDSRVAVRVREALATGRIRVCYQPVLRLTDGSTAYFESLVRIVTSDEGLLMPTSFLSVAERLGLMPRLTRRVFIEVAEALSTLDSTTVSLNLCGSDLLDRSLPDYIDDGLAGRDIEPSRLFFEIPEKIAVSHEDVLTVWFERFALRGHHFVLDRFDAGARGLALVNGFPFSQVKLDVSTLALLADQGGGADYLEAIRRVVEAHGLTVVASHIEDPRILQRVREAGFRYVQGYDIGRPRSVPE